MKRSKTCSATIALLLAACSASSPSNDADAQPVVHGSKPFEVAGVRPGMTVDEATAILKARGFSMTIVLPSRSYENAIADSIARTSGKPEGVPSDNKGIGELSAKKGDEEVSMSWPAPGPGNGTVLSVTYSAGLGARSQEAFQAEVLKRYGQPTERQGDRQLFWCATSDSCTTRNVQPRLTYDGRGSDRIWLSIDAGSRIKDAAKQRLATEVTRRVGKPASSF